MKEIRLASVKQLMATFEHDCHPGLMLDKLAPGVPGTDANDKHTVEAAILGACGDRTPFTKLLERHRRAITGTGATSWKRK